MIVLAEIKQALLWRAPAGVLIGFVPTLANREHSDERAARPDHAKQLARRLPVVDVFEDMEANHDIEGCIGDCQRLDVLLAVHPLREEVRRRVGIRPLIKHELADRRFRREMQDGPVPEKVVLPAGEGQQAVTLQRAALRAQDVTNIRVAIAEELAFVVTQRAFARELAHAAENGFAQEFERAPICSEHAEKSFPAPELSRPGAVIEAVEI